MIGTKNFEIQGKSIKSGMIREVIIMITKWIFNFNERELMSMMHSDPFCRRYYSER